MTWGAGHVGWKPSGSRPPLSSWVYGVVGSLSVLRSSVGPRLLGGAGALPSFSSVLMAPSDGSTVTPSFSDMSAWYQSHSLTPPWGCLEESFGLFAGPYAHVLEEVDNSFEDFFYDFREGDVSIVRILWCEVTPLFPHHPTRREYRAWAKLHRRYLRRGRPRVRLLRVTRLPPPGLLLPRPWDCSQSGGGCGIDLSEASCARAHVVGLSAQCSGGGAMLDSGSARCLLSRADMLKWGAPHIASLSVTSANSGRSAAVGGCPLYARVRDQNGRYRRILLSHAAYGVEDFEGTLLSEGLAWHHKLWVLDKTKQALTFFDDSTFHVPCQFSTSSYTWTLDMEIEPWSVTQRRLASFRLRPDPAVDFHDYRPGDVAPTSLPANLVPVVPALNPFAKANRLRGVEWPLLSQACWSDASEICRRQASTAGFRCAISSGICAACVWGVR